MTETKTTTQTIDNLSVLRIDEVLLRTGLTRTRLYDMIAKREFPHPISLSVRTVGWIEGEIVSWLVDRMKMRPKS